MIWYEPWVLFDWGIPTFIGTIEDSITPPRIGFAFHNYIPYPQDIPFREIYDLTWNNAIDHSNATGAALLATEFGADISTKEFPAAAAIQEQMNSIDGKMLPAIYWAYWNRTPYDIVNPFTKKPIPSAPMGIVDDLDAPRVPPNVNEASLLALTRPYPMFIAGTPVSWSFDPATKVFSFSYVPDPTLGNNVTEIFVPDLQYPNGFTSSTSGSGKSWKEPQALLIRTPETSEMVEVSISPADRKACPGSTRTCISRNTACSGRIDAQKSHYRMGCFSGRPRSASLFRWR